MNGLLSGPTSWLLDYYLLATALLAVVLVANGLIHQPARRRAIAWSAVSALFALALLCAWPNWAQLHIIPPAAAPPIWTEDLQPLLSAGVQEATLLPTPAMEVPDVEPVVAESAAAPVEIMVVDYGVLSLYLFLAGSSLVVVWLALGAWQVNRLCARAALPPEQLSQLFQQVARGAKTLPGLGVAEGLPVPVAVGLWRPMILLPAALVEQSPPGELRTVLAHELAHVRHRDLWLLAALRTLFVVLWANPLFWLLRRRVRLDQEMLADAAATETSSRHDYAQQLVQLARTTAAVRPPRLASSVGLWESPSQLKRRIALLLDEKFPVWRTCSRRWSTTCAALTVVSALALSLVTLKPANVALAEAQPENRESALAEQTGGQSIGKATVKLIAIGTHGGEKVEWWTAEGKPLESPPFRLEPVDNISPPPNQQLVFSVAGLDDDADVRWETLPESNTATNRVFPLGPDDRAKYYSHEFVVKPDAKTFQLRVGIAAGKWTTVVSGLSSSSGILGKSVVFSDALIDPQGNTLVIVSHNFHESATRVVGVDKNGERHVAQRSGGTSAGPLNQTKWKFPGLLPSDLKTCELQARPYEWVEFKDLPANPDTTASSGDTKQKLMELHARLQKMVKRNTIHGICLDESGQPLAGVQVQVYSRRIHVSEENPVPIHSVKSNEQGEFSFVDVIDVEKKFPEGLPDESFPQRNAEILTIVGTIAGRVPGFGNDFAAKIAQNGKLLFWVMQPAQTLRGRVTDQQGQPVAGAQVKAGVLSTLSGAAGINTATTDANGQYVIADLAAFDAAEESRKLAEAMKANPNLSATSYLQGDSSSPLLVTHPRFAAKRATIERIPGTVEVQLEPGSVIEGEVRLPAGAAEGKSLVGSTVRLQRLMPQPELGERPAAFSYQIESAPVDETGRYRFASLPAGKYDLTADVEGWVTQGVENIEVAAGETTTAPDILLIRGGRVRVQLLDDQTGEPLHFEKPTRGYVNPQHRPQRAAIFFFRNNIVEFTTDGVCEIQLPAGKYAFLVTIPLVEGDNRASVASPFVDGDNMVSVLPDELDEWPTFDVVDGELLEISPRMRMHKQSEMTKTMVTVQAPASAANDKKEEDGVLIPATPPAEEPPKDEKPKEDEPPWSVEGRVSDGEGNPLADVQVRAATGAGTLLGGGKTITDAQGRYKLHFGPGMRMQLSDDAPLGVGVQAASIFAEKPGWFETNLCRQGDLLMSDQTSETIGDGAKSWGHKSLDSVVFPNKPKEVNFTMKPAAVLEGVFEESSRGWSVREQSLYVVGNELPPSSGVLHSATTDRNGNFRIDSLPTNFDWRIGMRVAKTATDLETEPFRIDEPGEYRCRLVLAVNEHDGKQVSTELHIADLERVDDEQPKKPPIDHIFDPRTPAVRRK